MSAQHVVDNEAAPDQRFWPDALKKLPPPSPVYEMAEEALVGASRVLEAELNDRVSYIHGRTVRGMNERDLAERWLTIAIDWLDASRSLLRDEKRYSAQRFGRCSVVFSPETGELW